MKAKERMEEPKERVGKPKAKGWPRQLTEAQRQKLKDAIARRKAEGLGWGRKKANATAPSVPAAVHAGVSGDVKTVIVQRIDGLTHNIQTLQAELDTLRKALAILEGGTA